VTNRSTQVSYAGAHYQVRKIWGRASQYACVTCSRPAHQWAYDGTDPESLTGYSTGCKSWTTGELIPLLYSRWPEFYMPMCRSCHKGKDLAARGGRIDNRGRRNPGGPTWKSMRRSA